MVKSKVVSATRLSFVIARPIVHNNEKSCESHEFTNFTYIISYFQIFTYHYQYHAVNQFQQQNLQLFV